MRKEIILSSVIITGSLIFFVIIYIHSNRIYPRKLINAPSSIGTEEDPQARKNFEIMQLADPKTGEIPSNIRKKETVYSLTLPRREIVNRTDNARSTENYESSEWTPRGPDNVGGRTRALSLDTKDEDIILAGGVSGGMWRSIDGGFTWEKKTHPSSIHSVTCIAQDTRAGKENTWYYGTGELQGNSARGGKAPFRGDGIFKSTDNGETWEMLPSTDIGSREAFNSQFQYIWNIATDPTNLEQDEVFVAAYGGILRSLDGGASWQVVLGEDLREPDSDLNRARAPFYTDISIDQNGAKYAVMSQNAGQNMSYTNNGVFYSQSGVNWINITPNFWPRVYERTVIGIAPSNPNIVYFVIDAQPVRLFKLTVTNVNGGSSVEGFWENLSDNVPMFGEPVGDFETQGSYNMIIKVHPENEDIVYLGGTNLYRSTDGFKSLENISWIGGYDTTNDRSVYQGHYVDQHAIVFYPSDPDQMLTGNDGGVQVTYNNRASDVSWNDLNNGYITSQFYTLAIDKSRINDIIIGGMQDNGTYITNNGNVGIDWRRVLGGDGGFSAVAENAYFYYCSFQQGQVYRVTLDQDLDLTSFARVDPIRSNISDAETLFINPFELDPNNNHIMYLAGGDLIWRNDNLSQIPSGSQEPTRVNWEPIQSSAISSGSISAVSVSTLPANYVYYGTTDGKVYRIDEARSPDPEVREITGLSFPPDGYVSNIAVDPSDADRILVVFSNYNVISMFLSEDGGQSYAPVSGNLEEFADGSGNGPSIRWAEIIPLDNGDQIYFAGTSTGLYSSTKLEGVNTQWVMEGANQIGNVVVTMIDYRSLDGQVVIATHGNGIFSKKYQNVLVLEKVSQAEDQLLVSNAYPNPFSDNITIKYTVPQNGVVKASIFNSYGENIRTILYQVQYEGENEITWDGTNASNTPVADGIYFCQFEYQNQTVSRRIILKK